VRYKKRNLEGSTLSGCKWADAKPKIISRAWRSLKT
jgi:hypothetical protein